MKAMTLLESSPPDRNAPIGTSLTICSRTDRSISERSSSIQSCSLLEESTPSGSPQNWRTSMRPSSAIITHPGASFLKPANSELGALT